MIGPRHPDWEERLAAVLADWRERTHAPQPGQDCAAFVLAAVEAVAGFAPASIDAAAYRSAAGQARHLKQLGWASLDDAADALLPPRIAPLAAHRGDVVSDGQVLGVMTGAGPLAFGEDGMALMQGLVAAWPVGRADG